MVGRRLFAAALAIGGLAAACQLVAGIERVQKGPVPPDEVAVPPPETSTPPDPCSHATPIGPPAVDDAPSDALPDMFLALRKVSFVTPPGQEPQGLDLDGVCTCDTRPFTAHDGGSSCNAADASCDLDGGVDNSLLGIFQQFALIDIDKAANVQARIDEGVQNAIVVVTRYNGRANDKDVGFGIYGSQGITDKPTCDGSVNEIDHYTPGWCGTDPWNVDTTTIIRSGTKFVPKAAGTGYINDYHFVVELTGALVLPFAGFQLSFQSAVVYGTLVPLDATLAPKAPGATGDTLFRIENAVVTGRVPAGELLGAGGTIATPGGDGGPGGHLCTSPLFDLLKPVVCNSLDIAHAKSLDFDPNVACDSLSLASTFRADPTGVGSFVDPDAAPNECYPTPDGTRPLTDATTRTYVCP